MKKIIATSLALVGILSAASGPVFADSITDLVNRTAIVKFCADKQVNSKNPVQLTLADGTLIMGSIECEEEYFISSSSSGNDSFHNNKSDNDDYDDDDHDDDDDDHDDDDHDDD